MALGISVSGGIEQRGQLQEVLTLGYWTGLALESKVGYTHGVTLVLDGLHTWTDLALR